MVGAFGRPLRSEVVVALAAAALLLVVVGCEPDCRQACSHVVDDCGIDRPNYGQEDCTIQCERFLAHYDDEWQRDKARQSVRCVRTATCEELASGMPCYDEAVYVW
ncbi:MAG TPA: hypothetical protein DIU15_08615 [Deltaproteobacteria bacterium]|nr:hypothetical protein [Deltaproteobacteria bacterium]HCP46089.1 hypothetical protein [Deltaproteobacteria bacterium]